MIAFNSRTNVDQAAGMVKVAISTAYQGASTKLLPTALTTLTTEACFPAQS